jgi:mRNA interferase HigB
MSLAHAGYSLDPWSGEVKCTGLQFDEARHLIRLSRNRQEITDGGDLSGGDYFPPFRPLSLQSSRFGNIISAMRIIAWSVLSSYAERHPETKVPLQRWRTLVRSAKWNSMEDVRLAAPNAKILNGERARFEIAGGNFRMIVALDFGRSIAFVKFIGTHAEYDRIDALTVAIF